MNQPVQTSPGQSIRIAPSILSADFGRLAEEVKAVAEAGADLIHVDVMDGHFVPNLTIGPLVVKAVRKATTLPLDVHLMIEDAERWAEDYIDAGADIVYVHPEACPHLHRVLQKIRARGKQAAAAINPSTPLDALDYVLEDLSAVLIMSVNPGFGGQAYIPSATRKIADLNERLRQRGLLGQVTIAVDGGIKSDTIAEAAQAGARQFVAGNAVFASPDYGKTIAELRARAIAAAQPRPTATTVG